MELLKRISYNEKNSLQAGIATMVVACLIIVYAFGMSILGYLDAKDEIKRLEREVVTMSYEVERLQAVDAQNKVLREQLDISIDALEESLATSNGLADDLSYYMQLAADENLENIVLKEYYLRTTGHEIGEIKPVKIEATKYTNAEGWWDRGDPNYGMTASGTFTSYGTVAAPKSVPFGTTVLLSKADNPEDYKRVYTVEDRGSAIIEDEDGEICIDIWTEESKLKEALAFGRQYLEGYLIIPKEES